jgi:hypothetical protein
MSDTSAVFNLPVIDSQLYCEYSGYHGRQLDPHHIASHRTHRVGVGGNPTACLHGFLGRKGLPLVITRLVYRDYNFYFSDQIQPIQPWWMADTWHMVEPILLSSWAFCFALVALFSGSSEIAQIIAYSFT